MVIPQNMILMGQRLEIVCLCVQVQQEMNAMIQPTILLKCHQNVKCLVHRHVFVLLDTLVCQAHLEVTLMENARLCAQLLLSQIQE